MNECTLALWITHCSLQSTAEYNNENSIDPSSGAATHIHSNINHWKTAAAATRITSIYVCISRFFIGMSLNRITYGTQKIVPEFLQHLEMR